MKRRLGTKSPAESLQRMVREGMPGTMLKRLRKGTLAETVGPEAVSLLESCAASANANSALVAERYVQTGDLKSALEPYQETMKTTETLMNAALERTSVAMHMRRPLDEDGLDDLRRIDAQMREVHEEGRRLRREFSRLETAVPDHILPQERARANAELDQQA